MRKTAIAIMAALLSSTASAQTADAHGNALPDCFQYAKIQRQAPAQLQTELFIVVDQTTPLTPELRQSLAQQIAPLLVPGNAVSVFAFSAFTQGYYTRRLVHARMDLPMDQSQRNASGKSLLQKFDQCLQFQKQGIQKLTQEALVKVLTDASTNISKSDVWGSLQSLSTPIRDSSAQRKVVLLVSDMLENSSISSFYQGRAVRRISPDAELKKLQSNGLTADFAGANIYVLGAGLLGHDGGYRDPKVLSALRDFWTEYFAQSNAKLQEFGTPDLLGRVQ